MAFVPAGVVCQTNLVPNREVKFRAGQNPGAVKSLFINSLDNSGKYSDNNWYKLKLTVIRIIYSWANSHSTKSSKCDTNAYSLSLTSTARVI